MIGVSHRRRAGGRAICLVDSLGTRCHVAAKTLDEDVADHVSGSSTVNGYAHRVLGVEHVYVRRLARLYAEDVSTGARPGVLGVAVWFGHVGSGLGFGGVIKDVGDLSGFGYVLAVLVWEETAFTQEVAAVRSACLFTEWARLGWTVGSSARLLWSSGADRLTIATNSGAHNLSIVGSAYFV